MFSTGEIFSLSESELSELLKDIKEKCGSGKLPSDETGRLVSHLDSILGNLLIIQHESSHDLIKKVMAAIKSIKRDLERWYEHIKTLTEYQEKIKEVNRDAVERDREASDKTIEWLVAEIGKFSELMELDKKAHLLADAQIEEFIKRSQEYERRLLGEIEQIEAQVKLKEGQFDELNQKVLNSGFLEAIQAAHPSVPLQTIRDEYNKYWSDPKIRTEKPFSKFAESLGISEEEINVHVSKHNLLGKIQEMQENKGITDVLKNQGAQCNAKLVESWVVDIKAIEALKVPEAKQKYLEARSDVISKCDLRTLTAFFEQRAKKIADITKELDGISKDSPTEAEKTKKKELEEERDDLLDDLNGLTQLVEKRFGKDSAEFEEIQGKVTALKNPIVADMPPPAAKPQGTVEGTTVVVLPAQTKEEQQSLDEKKKSLRQRLDEIKAEIEVAKDAGKDDEADKLSEEHGKLEIELKTLTLPPPPLTPSPKPLTTPPTPPTPAPTPTPPTSTPTTPPPSPPPPPSPAAKAAQAAEAAKLKPAVDLLTFDRAYAIATAVKVPDTNTTAEAKKTAMVESCAKTGKEVIGQIKSFEKALQAVGGGSSSLAGDMRQEFCSMMADLKKGSLPPIYDLDYTKPAEAKKTIRESVDKTLPTWEAYAKNSGINVQKYKADKANAAKTQEQISLEAAEKEFAALREKIIDLRVQQYAIGATTEGMDIEASNTNANIEWKKRIDQLRDEQYYKEIAEKGPADESFTKLLHEKRRAQNPEEYLNLLKSNAKEVAAGLYVKLDKDGNELYIVKTVTPDNIQKVIEAKRGQKQINWNNVPKEDVPLIENLCLANWKRVTFDGNPPTTLSELMPERKGDWSGWVRNVNARRVMGWSKRDRHMEQLVQKIVGNDPERLKEFMLDLRNASEKDRVAALQCLTNKQRDILLDDARIRLQDLDNKKAKTPAPTDVEIARLNAEIANVKKELEVFSEADPKMAEKVLAVAPSIGMGEHYLARLSQVETKLKNAEELKASGAAANAVAVAEEAMSAAFANAAASVPVPPPPAPGQPQLKEYLAVQDALSREMKSESIDIPRVTKLMESAAVLAKSLPPGQEKTAAENLIKACEKFLEAKKELKVINDDSDKLEGEIAAVRKGLLGVVGVVGKPLALPDTQISTLQQACAIQLTKLTNDLSQVEKDILAVRNELRTQLNPMPSAAQSAQLQSYLTKRTELFFKKQETLEVLEKNLSDKKERLAQTDPNNKGTVSDIKKSIKQTEESIKKVRSEIAKLEKEVTAEKVKVQDPGNHKDKSETERETNVVKDIEKLVESLQSKEEKRKKIAGKLATAARETGEFIGSTIPPDKQPAVITLLTSIVKGVIGGVGGILMESAHKTSDELHPEEAEKRKKKRDEARSQLVPHP